MPNVNTIIVDRADKLGLAQLYQLRGRVGRSHQKAYAYLLIPPLETLNQEAMKRLRAIEEFSDIGSGAMLAMRDLEIRGAGNLLGAEQTGFIDALGFELYNKVLDEAVQELKDARMPEEEKRVVIDTQVEIDCDAYIPESYIDSGSERVSIYRRLTDADTMSGLLDVRSELLDRFGELPAELENLLNFIAIRTLASRLGIARIRIQDTVMLADFARDTIGSSGEPFKAWLGSIMENATQPFEFVQNESITIRMDCRDNSEGKLAVVKSFLQSLAR
jgi:transcription-repair coupling factor (superfamily II helicase)